MRNGNARNYYFKVSKGTSDQVLLRAGTNVILQTGGGNTSATIEVQSGGVEVKCYGDNLDPTPKTIYRVSGDFTIPL